MSNLDQALVKIFERRQNAVNGAGPPVEDLHWEAPSVWKTLGSRHNRDIMLLFFIYLIVLVGFAILAYVALQWLGGKQNDITNILFGSVIGGTFFGLLTRMWDLLAKRQSTINLFVSEMLSLGRVFFAGNIIGSFALLYHSPGTLAGFADSARKENYFGTFERNSPELANLEPTVVNDVVAFYSFLKASRDATGALQLWEKPGHTLVMKQHDVVVIVYLCFLMFLHGRRALEALVEKTENRDVCQNIYIGLELQCLSFLLLVVDQTDYRYSRIAQRLPGHRELATRYGYDIPLPE
jgi:hypothetical protein